MRKIYCDEVTCRYYDETKCTSYKLMISRRGKCTSYKPTILTYYRSVVEVLGDKNKPLTKHQTEFLFDYFTAMGMNSVANNYVTD